QIVTKPGCSEVDTDLTFSLGVNAQGEMSSLSPVKCWVSLRISRAALSPLSHDVSEARGAAVESSAVPTVAGRPSKRDAAARDQACKTPVPIRKLLRRIFSSSLMIVGESDAVSFRSGRMGR